MTRYGYDVSSGFMGFVEGIGFILFASYRDYVEYLDERSE